MNKLTENQKVAYIGSGGVRCPHCKSENITGSHIEVDSTSAWQDISCDDCEMEWRDIYTLTDIEDK